MFYEEKIIHGVLMWRKAKRGKWKRSDLASVNKKLSKTVGLMDNQKKEIQFLKERINNE